MQAMMTIPTCKNERATAGARLNVCAWLADQTFGPWPPPALRNGADL
jgi:hypothetical protein